MSMPDAGGVNDAGGENDVTVPEPAARPDARETPGDTSASTSADAKTADAETADVAFAEETQTDGADEAEERQPIVTSVEREVTVERSVRYGRILIAGAVLGALIAILASVLRPLGDGAEYTLGEVAGFMALIGAAIGLGAGGLFALILTMAARKRRGRAVAVQSDVQ